MIDFSKTPRVPLEYAKARNALTDKELTTVLERGYVSFESTSPLHAHNEKQSYFSDVKSLDDWRNRMFLVWFLYIFENFYRIPTPVSAIEEIILELEGGPIEICEGRPDLASLYAGASSREPLSESELDDEVDFLRSYYQRAKHLLDRVHISPRLPYRS